MKPVDRRKFLTILSTSPLALSVAPFAAQAMDCKVEHPFMPMRSEYQGQCPVCGMVRPMWARTWISFTPLKGISETCSFHCLADWAIKSGQEPADVRLTVYHEPKQSVEAAKAHIVLGSNAAGTMSPVSKIVFADKTKADEFAQNCGGEVVNYARALEVAKASARKENKMINTNRLKKGKIVEPASSDACLVCNMYPARYPYGKCQIRTKEGKTLHFCSTQCLFAFLGKQALFIDTPVKPFLIWVVDRNSGMWISGRAAFYAVGSSKVFGPMGFEAFPFYSLKEAEDFVAENGGKAVGFGDVTIERVVPKWKYRS